MSNIPLKPYTVLSVLFIFSLFISDLSSQTLVGGSLYQRSAGDEDELSNDRLWLSYATKFEFKKGMSIDSDFGHQSFSNGIKRFNVRSIFHFDLSRNWTIGAGMGFFWDYDVPVVSQELRFAQEVIHRKDYGSTIISHRLRFEEQITQILEIGDEYNTRWRYELDLTVPTRSGVFFGVRDEIFSNVSAPSATPFISTNRFTAFAGYDTFRFFELEAQIIMEDSFRTNSLDNRKSWVFRIAARHTL